ncbi:MAG: RNA-directed DNA polymerase [Methylotenera sp.]|nr:RNA-directed DNA polymerase [Methylotenera sp.]
MKLSSTPLFLRLLELTPYSEYELATLILTAPTRYKEHYIVKRHGRGKRLISQPTAELKLLQHTTINKELNKLEIHNSATAYRCGSSILHHAQPHANSNFLLKLDFKDFFPSLTDKALKHKLRADTNYSELEIDILRNILLKKDRKSGNFNLSIGAPSSPYVSNYLMNEFDMLVSIYCKTKKLAYSRYADDIAISSTKPYLLDEAKSYIDDVLLKLDYLGLILNQEKTVNVSKKHHRELVGLVLSNDGQVSLGRDGKRNLRAGVNALINGKLDEIAASKLKGQLAFYMAIDRDFVLNMCKKYGFNSIVELSKKSKP